MSQIILIRNEDFLNIAFPHVKDAYHNYLAFLINVIRSIFINIINLQNRYFESKQIAHIVNRQIDQNFPSTEKIKKLIKNYLYSYDSILKGQLGIGTGRTDRDKYLSRVSLSAHDYAIEETDQFTKKYSLTEDHVQKGLLDIFEHLYKETSQIEKFYAEKLLDKDELTFKELHFINLILLASNENFPLSQSQKNELRAFISDSTGNLKLNSRIRKYLTTYNTKLSEDQKKILGLIATFTFRTVDIQSYVFLEEQLSILIQKRKRKEPIDPKEKLTLKQVGILDRTSTLLNIMKKLDRIGIIQHDPQLLGFKNTLNKIHKQWDKVESEVRKLSDYRSGDLIMYDSSKFSHYLNKKLDRMVRIQAFYLRSKEFHSALIDVEPTRRSSSITVAHIQPEGYKKNPIQTGILAYSNIYRFRPESLLSKKAKEKTQAMLYRTKRGHFSWKRYIQEKYQKALSELLRDKEQFDGIQNPMARRFKSGIPGHRSFQATDFEKYDFTQHSELICSEFIAIIIGKAISRANMDIQEDMIAADLEKSDIITNPINSYEKLDRVHTERLTKILFPFITKINQSTIIQDLIES